MTDYIRTQIMLEKEQKDQIEQIAESMGVSFSETVRDFLNSQLRLLTYEKMQKAAKNLYSDYSSNGELTNMAALDGEDFVNE